MATNTLVAIDSVTLGSNQGAVTFQNIPQTYTNLRLIIKGGFVDNGFLFGVRVGNDSLDTGANYSHQVLRGDGSTGSSYAKSSMVFGGLMKQGPNNVNSTVTVDFLNYSNTTTNKTWVSRYGNAGEGVDLTLATWRSTAAINTISIAECGDGGSGSFNFGNLLAGTTISLYGIRAEGVVPAAKATGGVVYSDSLYYYHVFDASGTFTPSQSLTCDYLVIAGGGGGVSGGGGAGGLRSTLTATGGGGSIPSALSLSASAYTITVGAGGAKGFTDVGSGATGTNGLPSSIAGSGITTVSTVGGGAGGQAGDGTTRQTGISGGSGGGAAASGGSTNSGGAPTANEGFAGGGNGGFTSSPYGVGGGGGAAAAGATATGAFAMAGGAGLALSTWATPTGTGVNGYYAGGGGGGAYFVNTTYVNVGGVGGGGKGGQSGSGGVGTAGVAYTGSGGGGGGNAGSGGNGGSGLVIIRYAK